MTRTLITVLCGGLVLSALPLGRTAAYDGYGSPDPGSYLQGSGWSPADSRYDDRGSSPGPDYAADRDSDWYSSDWFRDQVDPGYRDYGAPRDEYRSDERRRQPRPEARPYDYPAAGDYRRDDRREEAWDDWGEPYRDDRFADDRYRDDRFADDRYRDDRYRDDRYGQGDGRYGYEAPTYDRERPPDAYREPYQGGWSGPPRQPRYRFRDDPELRGGRHTGRDTGYQFRPLTRKELERRREPADRYQYTAPVPAPRWPDPDGRARDDREEAFGYEPDTVPDSFYDRYYRSGP